MGTIAAYEGLELDAFRTLRALLRHLLDRAGGARRGRTVRIGWSRALSRRACGLQRRKGRQGDQRDERREHERERAPTQWISALLGGNKPTKDRADGPGNNQEEHEFCHFPSLHSFPPRCSCIG